MFNELKLETKHNACFVAGTLVHTDKGLVPIQDIKVGDMVLSRDEFNPQGDLQYKPVLSTFKSQQKERIYKVEYPTNDGMEYIFCNALHPFWSAYDPSGKTGKWEAAEDLSGTFLVNLSGETFGLDNVPFMPVRTLPNYPEGCAYVQFVEDPDFWKNGGGLIEFVKFDSNGYQFISLADNEEAFDEEIKTLNHKTLDAKLRLTPKANFLVDKELYKTLNVRLDQDIDADTHTAQKFIEASNKPLIFEGKIVRENSIADEELYRQALKNIETYGDATGLTEMSLHEAMISFDMPAPNPYEDFVYNLEVDGNHTYFVGHDGIWVHNACPKFSIKDVKSYNKNVPVPKSHSEISKQLIRAVTKDGACFPAGTRITTDKGLKRIEDIQVGDMVLSKHESGIGEQEFKPVIRTVVHHNKPIFELTFAIVKNTIKENGLSDKKILNLSSKGEVYTIRATPNHPFWVKGQGWTSLDKLQKGQLLEMKESNTQAYVIFVSPQYQTNYSNIVATYGFENEIIFDEQSINNLGAKYELEQYDEKGDRKFLSTKEIEGIKLTVKDIGEVYVSNNIRLDTVYNFEVADNHTYYIGDFLWVHNTNCPVIPREKIESYDGSEVPKDMPFFNSLKEANDFFKSLPEDSDLLVPAIVRVGRVKVNSVTKGKINAVDFEHGSRNAIYAKIGDEYIQFEYIAFRKHPNYQTVDTNGVVTTNNSVLNFVKFEGFTEEMINGKLVKSYIDRKASLPYQALSTKKVAPAEKGVDGKLEFANAARHYAIDNLYNQLDSLTRTQNADHNLIYALKKQADIDVFNVQILEAIKDNSFELWKVDTDGYRTRTINGEPTKVWEGYKLKEVDSQSAQYKCKLLNINTNLNITGLITKNNKSMVYQNHLLKRVIKKLTFNGCF